MPSVTARRKATQRKALKKQGKRIRVRNRINRSIGKARATIAKRRKLIRQGSGDPGVKAVRYLLDYVGKTETPYGSNDAPFLAAWRAKLPSLSWMKGQPWCGFALIAGYLFGAGKRLPDDTVSTIAIANRARSGDGFKAVAFDDARPGDLIVMHLGSGGPKHVGLATGRARGGVVATVEGNTSSGNSGSQSNGGGLFLRSRPRGLVHTVARPK